LMFKPECIDHFHDCAGLEVEQIQRTGSQTYHCADGLYKLPTQCSAAGKIYVNRFI